MFAHSKFNIAKSTVRLNYTVRSNLWPYDLPTVMRYKYRKSMNARLVHFVIHGHEKCFQSSQNKITQSLCFHSNCFRIALHNLFMHSSLTNQKHDILLCLHLSRYDAGVWTTKYAFSRKLQRHAKSTVCILFGNQQHWADLNHFEDTPQSGTNRLFQNVKWARAERAEIFVPPEMIQQICARKPVGCW